MFIISLTYQVPLAEVDRFIPEHIDYLNEQYAKGYFILSGRKEPRTGGVIISSISERQVLNQVLAQDPFYREGLASYEITEIVPTKSSKQLAFLISNTTNK
ncbi:YciI family protein [Pseudoalteromonas byunsanensis]|uniref:GTP cyclohydrolase n=1 Tax=Pseudoalteromonas byunsanensis TaxID=327939 RepID=A0A1S1N171_9GAMM|nr:YciI family protein [Pseudoalteromonas byunsanensis]OHU94939.1 GTP cyclohydrolase [Pseudoalteromonas byunsanensis]